MLSKRCISIQTLRFKAASLFSSPICFIMVRLMKQHYKQNWPHNTRLSIQLAQWPLPKWVHCDSSISNSEQYCGMATHTMWCSLCWPVPGQFLATNGKNISMDTSLRHRVPGPGAVAVFLLALLLLLLVKIAGKYSLETKIQMKILLNSIGQTLQEHGPSTHSTAM